MEDNWSIRVDSTQSMLYNAKFPLLFRGLWSCRQAPYLLSIWSTANCIPGLKVTGTTTASVLPKWPSPISNPIIPRSDSVPQCLTQAKSRGCLLAWDQRNSRRHRMVCYQHFRDMEVMTRSCLKFDIADSKYVNSVVSHNTLILPSLFLDLNGLPYNIGATCALAFKQQYLRCTSHRHTSR